MSELAERMKAGWKPDEDELFELLEEIPDLFKAALSPFIEAMKEAEERLRAEGNTLGAEMVAMQLLQYDVMTNIDVDDMTPDEMVAMFKALTAKEE